MDPKPPIVIYDGDCPLCRQLASWGQAHLRGCLNNAEIGDFRQPLKQEYLSWIPWQTVCQPHPNLSTSVLSQNLIEIICPQWAQYPQSLFVIDGTILLKDGEAWSFLLKQHPQLSQLLWLAEKMGWQKKAITSLQSGAAFLRRLCRKCQKGRFSPADLVKLK